MSIVTKFIVYLPQHCRHFMTCSVGKYKIHSLSRYPCAKAIKASMPNIALSLYLKRSKYDAAKILIISCFYIEHKSSEGKI